MKHWYLVSWVGTTGGQMCYSSRYVGLPEQGINAQAITALAFTVNVDWDSQPIPLSVSYLGHMPDNAGEFNSITPVKRKQ